MARRKKQIHLPSERHIKQLLSGKSARNKLIIVLALKMGLRASEICNAKINDLNLEEKTLSFRAKGGDTHTLPLTEEVIEYIVAALSVRPNHSHPYLIWNTRKDSGIKRFTLNYLFKRWGKQIGIHLHPHLLRHVFGTNVLENYDLATGKELMRHKHASTTADNYFHPSIEYLRDVLEKLDTRSWFAKCISKFKPTIPQFLLQQPLPDFTETIGRSKELKVMTANLKAGIATVLCGPSGVGISHLLRQIPQQNAFYLDELRPVREKVIELATALKQKNIIAHMPQGRGTNALLKSLLDALDTDKNLVLVIDSISNITKDGISVLIRLKKYFTIFCGIAPQNRNKAKDIFYGSHDLLHIEPLSNDQAYQLADNASFDLQTTPKGREIFLRKVVSQSRCFPKSIIEIIQKEKKRNRIVDQTTPISYESGQEPLSAVPMLSLILLVAVISRYGASSVGFMDGKIILIAFIIILSVLVFIDKIIRQDSTK